MVRIALIVVAVLVVGLQFFRGEAPEVVVSPPNDLLTTYQIDVSVSSLLKEACYDCHSNETRYPWYAYITPFSWSIFEHIEEGREELNFSDWATLPLRTQLRKLNDINKALEEGTMPMESYARFHPDARLTPEQNELIMAWADKFGDQLMEE